MNANTELRTEGLNASEGVVGRILSEATDDREALHRYTAWRQFFGKCLTATMTAECNL